MKKFTDKDLDQAFDSMTSSNLYQLDVDDPMPPFKDPVRIFPFTAWLCVLSVLVTGLVYLIDQSEARWFVNRLTTPLFLW